jgi:hypothetical protein
MDYAIAPARGMSVSQFFEPARAAYMKKQEIAKNRNRKN